MTEQDSGPANVMHAARKSRNHFPFLDLPPELRNRIYNFMTSDKPRTPIEICRDGKREPHKHWSRPVEEQNPPLQPLSDSGFFGLTQTCQLTRLEFRPMYIHNMWYSIYLTQLNMFLDDFGFNKIKDKVGHVVDALQQEPLSADGVDVLPLFEALWEMWDRRPFELRGSFVCVDQYVVHLTELIYGSSVLQRAWIQDQIASIIVSEQQMSPEVATADYIERYGTNQTVATIHMKNLRKSQESLEKLLEVFDESACWLFEGIKVEFLDEEWRVACNNLRFETGSRKDYEEGIFEVYWD